MGLWNFHHLMGRGVSKPPLTRILDVVAKNGKMRSEVRQKSLRKYLGVFSKVNIEVTGGQQRSNLAKIHISYDMHHYLRNYFR